MRDGRGILVSACLASVKRLGGGELDTPSCGFKEGNQKGSPRPADVPSRTGQPVVEADGKSQDEAVTLEMKHGQPEASLAPRGCHQALALEEPLGRESAAAADGSQAAGLCSAAGERPAGASSGIREAPGSHWPRRGPRAAVSHAGQCPRGEFQAAVWPGHPEPWEMGVFKGSPPGRFPKEPGMEWQLSCPSYELTWLPRTCLEVLKDEATWVSLGLYLKPMFLEPTTEFEKTPSSTSDGLQIIPRLPALGASD